MKKLFSIFLTLVVFTTLVGCVQENEITVKITKEDSTVVTYELSYKKDYDGTLIELIEGEVHLNYSTSEYGTMILEAETLVPKNGNYIALYYNGEMSSVGIDDIEFKDGDEIGFEIVWWDKTLEAIEQFLNNHAEHYTSIELLDYNVIKALDILGVLENYLTLEEVSAVYNENTVYATTKDLFKAIIIKDVVGLDYTYELNELNSQAAIGDWGKTAFDLIGLNATTHDLDFSAFETAALTALKTTDSPFTAGLDTGGMTLVALSDYIDDESVLAVVTEFKNWISTDQLETGGILTRDNGWGQSENAASISSVIIGLISCGIDPAGTDFTKDSNTLVSRLLDFKTSTGSYKWILGEDQAEDLSFSTPQAFLAVVMYQEYKANMEAVNPYK